MFIQLAQHQNGWPTLIQVYWGKHCLRMVVIYIDDNLVFSRTLEEHLEHLQMVIEQLEEAGTLEVPVYLQGN